MWNWLKKKTVQEIAKAHLEEAQFNLLVAELNLERALAEQRMYSERVGRLSPHANVTSLRREREG